MFACFWPKGYQRGSLGRVTRTATTSKQACLPAGIEPAALGSPAVADPENFGGGGFEAQNLKNSDVFTKIESDFSAEIGNSNVFFAQIQVVSKKKKVFTKIETDFSPDSLRLGRWRGMHPEMETNYSKQRLIFRPKSLLLGWWGGMHPPHPPPKSATDHRSTALPLELEKTSPRMLNFEYLNPAT